MSTRSPWTRGHPPGELLSSYVDGELEPDVRAALVAHVETCADCTQLIDSFRGLRSTLKGAPAHRAPSSLNRDVWQRIEQHDASRRRGLRLPPTTTIVAFGTNALGLAAIAVLVAIIAPGARALFQQLMSPTVTDSVTNAAQPTVASRLAASTSTPWPTQTVVPAWPTATLPRPTELPTPVADATSVVPPKPSLERTPVPSPPQSESRSLQPTATKPEASRTIPTPVPTVELSAVAPIPTVPLTAPALRSVSGTVSFVDRKAKTLTVTAPSPAGERSVSVVVSDGTQYSRADGRRTSFEDVGIADQVDVSGFDGSAQVTGLLASTIRITVSAVAVSPPVRAPRVLYVADGAESIRTGQYGFTGDWARRLASTGYDVTTADPARATWTSATLKDFDLIVIGAPATLGDAAISTIKSSHLPILDADPRLVQTLGLGVNVDPANPLRQAPTGRTVDIVASDSRVTRGLASGETIIARDTVYRTPIVTNGLALATVTDSGQRRAVWSQTGSSMYLGAWNSASGANHTDAYWSIFDRSVVALLGRDPSARPSSVGPTPTSTRTPR